MQADPLVATLRCSGHGWEFCQALRDTHFPPSRNIVPAHIALFHHLPGEHLSRIEQEAQAVCSHTPSFAVAIGDVRSLGGGVALQVRSPRLLALHGQLAHLWAAWLTPQDRSRFAPHVTVQNKVAPGEARCLLKKLQVEIVPFSVEALGVELWHYRGGPWQPAAFAPFAEP